MKVFSLIVIASVIDVVLSNAIIGNDRVIIGVGTYANLNVPYVSNILGLPNSDPLEIYNIGLRNGNVPNGDAGIYAATEHGALAEGWGAGVKEVLGSFTSTCGSNRGYTIGAGMELIEFAGLNGGSTAKSDVKCGRPDMTVTHDFKPSTSPDLMQVDVTIRNTGVTDFQQVHYRRVMDWDISPTQFEEYVTHIGVGTTASLIHSNSNGFCNPDPSTSCGPLGGVPENVDFTDKGPFDHGSMFQFNLGMLKAGNSVSFIIFYGASLGEPAALTAISDVQAELVSLGQQRNDSSGGAPYTFIFGFKGVGGVSVLTSEPSASPTEGLSPTVAQSLRPSTSSSASPTPSATASPTEGLSPTVALSPQPSTSSSTSPSTSPSSSPIASPSSSPIASPSVAPVIQTSASPSKSPSLRPSTVSSTFKWVLYDANKDVDISLIAMNQTFLFTSMKTNSLSIRLETPSNTRRVVFSWLENNRPATSTENTFPYYMNQNKGNDVFSVRYLLTPGVKTVTARVTDAIGRVIGTSTIRFTLV